MATLKNLQWRVAIKTFDSNKKLSTQQLNDLLAAIQLSPSSAGLQPYRVVVVEDADTRAKLREAGYGQAQITDASQLIVFAAETAVDEALVKNYIDLIAATRGVDREQLVGFEQMIVGSVNSKSQEERISWAQKQAYIALGVLLSAAATLQIDACPMEGFNPAAFDEILGLKEKGLTASVIAAVGFRSDEDVYSKLPKVRKPAGELFIHV
ncbi:MAG: NAD(P)H-dependent oxidoreductase [Bacteroidota bacterium]